MTAILGILPATWRPYAKTVVAVLGVVLYLAAQLAPFLSQAVQEGIQTAVLVLGALGVYATPNSGEEPEGTYENTYEPDEIEG